VAANAPVVAAGLSGGNLPAVAPVAVAAAHNAERLARTSWL
jgi:hypothetical protein